MIQLMFPFMQAVVQQQHTMLLTCKQTLHRLSGQALNLCAGDSLGQQSLLSMLTEPLQVSFCAEC